MRAGKRDESLQRIGPGAPYAAPHARLQKLPGTHLFEAMAAAILEAGPSLRRGHDGVPLQSREAPTTANLAKLPLHQRMSRQSRAAPHGPAVGSLAAAKRAVCSTR